MDADEDGIATADEYRAGLFDILGQDGDGLLEDSELAAQRKRGGPGASGERN